MTNLSPSLLAILLAIALLAGTPVSVESAEKPGATVRNAFGPEVGHLTNQCRGACGAGCPDSCDKSVSYECIDGARLLRVVSYECGTHKGCRTHDNCLDACLKGGAGSGGCQSQCDADVMQNFGLEKTMSWLGGGGPYDGKTIFEYTRDASYELEPAYHCPPESSRQCGKDAGCKTTAGKWVEPIFDTYPQAAAGAMHISDFRVGPACADKICTPTADIEITGDDNCDDGPCTRFGMEFDFVHADPTAPLECSTSTSGGDSDFIGDLLKQGSDAMATRSSKPEKDDGMGQMLNMFQQVISSADSPEDVQIKITPFDENGNPIESQSVGNDLPGRSRPIPSHLDIPATSGHLFVPMYELTGAVKPGQTKERRIRCTHRGEPVLETVVRLRHNTPTSQGVGNVNGGNSSLTSGSSSGNAAQTGCSCDCGMMGNADELCAFFCEEEFAACKSQ